LAILKPRAVFNYITYCFYMIYSYMPFALRLPCSRLIKDSKAAFQAKVSTSVQPCFTFLAVPLASSIFPITSLPDLRPATYDLPSSNVPPFYTPSPPSCAASTPSCSATTPSNATTTPCFKGLRPQTSGLRSWRGTGIPPSRRTKRFGGVSPACHQLQSLSTACPAF